MCGIAGFSINQSTNIFEQSKDFMSGIIHRGPDGNNSQTSTDNAYCFLHARLSVIDLTNNAQQPMFSKTGDWIITFNGEIYNFLNLKAELTKQMPTHSWTSSSDTEVLLTLIEKYGISKTLSLINGMFSFAAYHISSKKLYLARDRFGEKPLYYGIINKQFVFTSDLRALRIHYQNKLALDELSVKNFLKYGFMPSCRSIYRDISQLSAGSFLTVSEDHEILEKPFYKTLGVEKTRRSLKTDTDHISECERLIIESVSAACTSDVPIGFFLSGGIDSSVVCAIASELHTSPIDTYTIGFDESSYDESDKAYAVAEKLKTNHKTYFIQSDDIINSITNNSEIWSEPFADPSQIPMAILSKFVAKEKKVALSGDGGDELFCGYTRYTKGYEYFSLMNKIPLNLRSIIKKFIENPLIYKNILKHGNNHRILKLIGLLDCTSDWEYYDRILSKSRIAPLLFNYDIQPNKISDFSHNMADDFRKVMMQTDLKVYLPASVLTKVDRASMYYGLETRAPLLNHKLADYVSEIEIELLYKNSKSKYILKKVLEKYGLSEIVNRPKQGFDIPLERWLRGPLKDWAEDCISENNSLFSKKIDRNGIEKIWKEFLSGSDRYVSDIWVILTFLNWAKNKEL